MPETRIDQMRQNYTLSGLLEKDVHSDPMVQFQHWFDEAIADGIPSWLEPNAMTLSTASTDGILSSRIVLLKGIEDSQFLFFTNYDSSKGRQIASNPFVSLCFYWPHLQRQVLVSGSVARISRKRSESYFHSRPRGSQLGAHASAQSSVIESREAIESRIAELENQYPDSAEIPLPQQWGGYAVTSTRVEFWQGRTSRLHDRIVYIHEDHSWSIQRLSP